MKLANDERELTRLLNEDASGLSDHVAALREQVPSALELGALASGLAARGIGVTPSAASATPPAWKKWAAGGVGGAAVIVLWLALSPHGVHSEAAPVAPPRTLNEHVAAPPLVRPSASPNQPGPSLETATEASVAAPPSAAAVPSAAPAPAPATPVTDTVAVPRASMAKPLATTMRASSARATRASDSALPAGDAATQPSELELLRDARLAIRSSPVAALGLVDRHAQLYPQGKLTQERELIAISALVAMGRRTAALSRAASFERSFPGSAYRKQLEELLR